MSRATALVLLVLGFPLLLASFWLPAPVGAWVLIATNVLLPVALIGLAVGRTGRSAVPGLHLWMIALLVAGGFAGLLATTGDPRPVLGGWPAPALFLLLGLWVVPLLVVGWIYTRTFSSFTPSDDDLERLEEMARRRRDGESLL